MFPGAGDYYTNSNYKGRLGSYMGASLHKNQEDTTIQSKKLSRIPRKQGSLSWGFIGKEKRMTISRKSGQSAGRVDNQPGRVEECAGCMG